MANPEHLKILKQGVAAWNEWRRHNANLVRRADLTHSDLRWAYLVDADLREADLREADLYRADLTEASLRQADLREAILCEARLSGAGFSSADLSGADLTGARLYYTIFANVDLREARGLEMVNHLGPSVIGLDTFFKSKGKIPEVFLRGAGVPDIFLQYAASLAGAPFEFDSCFISYSTKDNAFVQRLYADLQSKGVRCWFAPEDLKIGDKFRVRIDEAIRVYDKLLIVLSRDSVESGWVEKEVETAFEKERREKRVVLFPIRVDQAVMDVETGWAADIRRTRHIGDFRKWKDHDAYAKAFQRLLRDLKSGKSKPDTKAA